MKALLQTHSVSFAESVIIALEAEGITAVVLDEQSAAALSFAGRIRVAVVNDADYSRAMTVVRTLEPPSSPPLPSWRWHKRGLVALGLGFLTILASSQMYGSRFLPVAALVGGALFFGGVLMIALGFRADLVHRSSSSQ